jgi:hypothetical protein
MSIALLTQVYDETRRLSIAGSSAAVGDFRLKKLAMPLEQAGQKAPVFAKVAQAINKLVESNEKTAPEAILDLSTLLNAILYTQGETGAPGKITPIETIDLGAAPTQTTARVLKPLLEALSNTGSGRLEVIKDAHARGVFRDLRLVKPALAALDDVYGEIADFVSEQVLPLYGTAILPELRAKFDHNGRGGNVRRLTLMHALDPSGSRELVKQSLEEGSKEVKVAAIECLGESTEDLQFLLDQAKAKSQDVRRAALKALGKLTTDSAVMVLARAIENDDLELAIAPIQSTASAKLKKLALDAARKHFEVLGKTKSKDKAEVTKQCRRMISLLECMRGSQESATDDFLLEMFEKRSELDKLSGDPGGKDVRYRLNSLLMSGPERSVSAFINAHPSLDEDELAYAFVAAIRNRSAKEVFDQFSPYYLASVTGKKSKGNDEAKAKKQSIAMTLSRGAWRHATYHGDFVQVDDLTDKLDPRWLDAAIEQKDVEVVMHLAKSGNEGVNGLLREAFDAGLKKKIHPQEIAEILGAMVHVGHPFATDGMISLITQSAKSPQNVYWFGRLIQDLPKDAAPKLEALLPGLPDKVVDQLLDHITELKNKPS